MQRASYSSPRRHFLSLEIKALLIHFAVGLAFVSSLATLSGPAHAQTRDVTWQVAEIYLATMGYAPDAEGHDYWIGNILSSVHWTPTTVAQSFFDQPLVQQAYPPGQGYGPFVESLYQNIFGRAPDAAGYAYWLGELEAGRVQRNQMIVALINGGWASPDALSDMARFGNRVRVVLEFIDYQQRHGIVYSELGDADRGHLRQAGRDVVEGIDGAEYDSRLVAERISALLNVLRQVRGYRLEVIDQNVWEFRTTERAPDHEYAGQHYEGGVVSFFPQAHIAADIWNNGRYDVLVPLNKGYASGIDTRVAPLLFRNDGTRFREAGADLAGGMPQIPGLRRTVSISDGPEGIDGVFGIAHDTGDGASADALLIVAGSPPRNTTGDLPVLPLAGVLDRDNAVDAHSLGAGDITGNGLTDIIVGEWKAGSGPYKLLQLSPGQWQLQEDGFLRTLAFEQPLEVQAGEGFNLLLDLHLVDVNGNGLADLVVGWGHGASRSYVYFNDGTGAFSQDARVALPESVYGIDNSLHLRTFDLDLTGNGFKDLVVVSSRFQPYYGGYALQILINDGHGNFADDTARRLSALPGRDRIHAERLQWSDNFYLLDVDGDGHVDIVGSDAEGVRLWLNDGRGYFLEASVDQPDWHYAVHMFVDMGVGRVDSLAFRQSWTNAEGTENRIWFEHLRLVVD